MDCNKDEAVRAKEIAERKVTEKDYVSARKFALKAQRLYPGLEGISQMLTTIDVYVSAEKKINGEVDWYAILGTNPWVDDETVRKQYRKLALALHPDKNKAKGADGAFKLVSEAWSLLSDKAKRLAYNEKLNPRIRVKNPSKSRVPFASPSANGLHTSASNVSSHARTQNNTTRVDSASVPSPSNQNPGTFWTICNRCKTQYEYLRIYLNHTLLCPNCHEAFLALEKPPPPNALKSSNLSSRQQHQNSRNHAASSNIGFMGHSSSNDPNLQWGPFSRMAGVNNKVATPSTATQQVHEKSKRESEEAWAAGLKKRRINDYRTNGNGGDMVNQMAMGNGVGLGSLSESRRGSFEAERIYGFSGINSKLNRERELSLFEIRNMLVDKARNEIRKKLKDWSSVTDSKTVNKEKVKMKEKENKKQKSGVNGELHDSIKSNESNKKYQNKGSRALSSDDDSDEQAPALSINVPDSDFHNFDLDRTESSFGDDQVWAAYDDDDGMPRYYARIHKVISLKPFKMRISWLNSRSNNELGPINWIDSGFTKTCGDFRTGRHEISDTLNSFSHKVKWTKGTRGVVRIFPSKGDVWALYSNWSPDWNEHTPDEVIHKYDMVEVLDDYAEDQGVSVTPLIKVVGLKSVFHKHTDPKSVWRIPKEEMFRFSHQVPGHLLTGQEAHNAPKGAWELDPAAIPVELLQVIAADTEPPMVENKGKVEEENASKTQGDELGENSANAEGEIVENGKQANHRR